MPCLLAIIALGFPRLVIVVLVIFSSYLDRAYDTLLWPILGFVFMPFTTLAYALAINSNGSVEGLYLVILVVAAIVDVGSYGGGHRTVFVKRR